MKKTKLSGLFIAVLGILIVFVSMTSLVLGHTGDDGYEHHCGMFGSMMPGSMYGAGIFSWLFVALVTVALVLLIIWLIKQIQKK